MNFPPEPDRWTIELANDQRTEAVAAFGFTERQARFLVNVLLHSGVFVERQYCNFAGIVHGQKSTDFMNGLVERRYATPIATGPLHRGRMFHVHYKPLWAAIGEPDSRFRKPAAQGRMIERVMLLDAVLDDRDFIWLGPAFDKRRHFMRYLGDRLAVCDFPHLAFGDGAAKIVRSFPDKLPIGIQPHSHPHVLIYLVTKPSPMDFRLFLLRHSAVLQVLVRWTVRLLFPRQLRKAMRAYQHAAREHLAAPVHPSTVEELQWFFRERQRVGEGAPAPTDQRYVRDASAFRAPQYRALYRHWLEEGDNALWIARSNQLADGLQRDEGCVECVELSRHIFTSPPWSTSRDLNGRTTRGTTSENEVVPCVALAATKPHAVKSREGSSQAVRLTSSLSTASVQSARALCLMGGAFCRPLLAPVSAIRAETMA